MGGIGKTVASTAIMRDETIRRRYDQMVYVIFGQTPVIDKVRNFAYLQLTGREMNVDWKDDEKAQQLRKAMVGKNVLLYLLWPSLSCTTHCTFCGCGCDSTYISRHAQLTSWLKTLIGV